MDFTEIRNHADRLRQIYTARDEMYEDLRRMFHMEWSDPPAGDWVKATMSPTAYNAAIGAVRLLTSAEPQWIVPYDEADHDNQKASEKIEKAARAMWNGNGRALGRPQHYDVVLSGVLYAMACGTIDRTEDLVKMAETAKNKGSIARMKSLAAHTPYLFRIENPATCYPDFDNFGLAGMLRRVQTTWGEVLDTWGQAALNLGLSYNDRTQKIVINDWYDWEDRAVWLESNSVPLYHDAHNLDFLPVVAQITEGSNLWLEPERNLFPFLYSLWKSGIWKRENLTLTTIYTLTHALASNPMLVRKTPEPGSPLQINRTIPGGVTDINPDESLTGLGEKVLDPSLIQGMTLANQLSEQSTIARTTLGAQPEGVVSYSAIAMLAQAGRLPLMGAKQLGGAAIATLMTNALKWWRKDGKKQSLYQKTGGALELSPSDIPEYLVLECNLEPDLPQDKLQMVNTAIASLRDKLASRRWNRENIMNIGQSEAMDKEIAAEEYIDYQVQRRLDELKAQDAMKMQMMQAQAQQMMQAQQMQGGQPGMMKPTTPQPQPGNGQREPVSPYPQGGVGANGGGPLSGPLPTDGGGSTGSPTEGG